MIILSSISIRNILLYFVLQFNITSVVVFAQQNDLNSEIKLSPAREQFKKWYDSPAIPLRSNLGELSVVNLGELKTLHQSIILTHAQEVALHNVININLEALCAKTFQDYIISIKKIAKDDLRISADGYRRMRWYLKAQNAVERPDLISDSELLEAYWMMSSKIGYSERHFVGLISDESYYVLSEIKKSTELNETPNPFPKDRMLCGAMLEYSSFFWQGSTPATIFTETGKLLIADIRYLIKTNVSNLAYPICIRVYWNKNIGTWLPWSVIVFNVTTRYCNVVF